MVFLIYIITLLIFIVSLVLYKSHRTFEAGKHFVGPSTYPVIGNGHLFINRKPEGNVNFIAKNFNFKEKLLTYFRYIPFIEKFTYKIW